MRSLKVSETLKESRIARLLARHELELATRAHSLRECVSQATLEVRDAVDSSVDSLARHVGASLLDVTSLTARGIESALRRLRSGAYGECQDCGGRISAARLRALPAAVRCRDCQQELEVSGWPQTA
jgi:DnaK suppressor protein